MKLLSKYSCVKGFKPLHLCNPTEHARTSEALTRFFISIVISALWEGELTPPTNHGHLAALSQTSRFAVERVSSELFGTGLSRTIAVRRRQVTGLRVGVLLAGGQRVLPCSVTSWVFNT